MSRARAAQSRSESTDSTGRIIFPTKRHWRSNSRLKDIDAGRGALVAEIGRLGLDSIAVPPLGADLGGLPWNDARGRIERALGALPDLRVVVFEPRGAQESMHEEEEPRGRRA